MSTTSEHEMSTLQKSTEDQLTLSDGDSLYESETAKSISLLESVCVELPGTKPLSQMERESKEKQEKIDCLLSQAEKTSLCFMVDCTGSMSPWINKVRENIKFWSERLHAKYTNMELLVALVRYTDYDQPKETRITTLDFTKDLDQLHHFLDGITTPNGVGGDTAEDVFGGLDAMLRLSWPEVGTKVLIHITDAPCHGRQYHDSTVRDDYPDGDPAGLQLDDLMKWLAVKGITYYFGYVNKKATLKMTKAFNDSLAIQSNKTCSIQQFDASNPNKLLEGVFRSVTCSIMMTLDVLKSGGTRQQREYTIDDKIPDWKTLPSQQVMISSPPTVGSSVKMEMPNKPMRIKIAPQPFGEGAQKIVYHAFDEDNEEHIVLKCSRYTDNRSNSIKRCLETAEIHAIAATYSATFNRARPFCVGEIQFVPVGVMQATANEKIQYFTYERYLGDTVYTKFNSNLHYIPEQEDDIQSVTCQAFSHYSWEKSGKTLVICDLQGVRFGSTAILTDPVIHYTHVLCHGSTNLGKRGIEKFLQQHKCNKICRAMKLKHPDQAK